MKPKFKKGTIVKVVRFDPDHVWSKEMLENLYKVRDSWVTWDREGKKMNQVWYGLDFLFDIYNTCAYEWQLEEVKVTLSDVTYL